VLPGGARRRSGREVMSAPEPKLRIQSSLA
jgi:hypothetical protein